MKQLSILLILTLTSCMTKLDDPMQTIDPVLLPYVNQFFEAGRARGIALYYPQNFVVVRQDVIDGGRYAGMTYYDTNTIVIEAGHEHDEQYMMNVVFHELGHLMLRRHHRSDTLPCGRSASIMDAQGSPYWYSEEELEYYLDELFGVASVTEICNEKF